MVEVSIFNLILTFFGAILGGVLTVLIGPWVSEKFKLREVYFVPFQTWCTEFYGDLQEFSYRYIVNKHTNDYSEFSDILVILDYRSLHDSLINSAEWFGKIQKESVKASRALQELLETVDKFWHHLENDYPLEIPSVEGVKEFNKSIKSLSHERRSEIAGKIRCELINNKMEYDKEKLEKILIYLMRQVPSNRWFGKFRKPHPFNTQS